MQFCQPTVSHFLNMAEEIGWLKCYWKIEIEYTRKFAINSAEGIFTI